MCKLPTQIELPNGSKELITNDNDLIDIADRFVSYEYSKIIENVVNTKSAEQQYAERKINTDLQNYETQLDEYNSCLQDLDEVVDKFEDYLADSKRITRDKITDYVTQIRKLINEYY